MYGVPAQSNDAKALRAKQIDALLKLYPMARIISPEKNMIDVPVTLPTSVQITFRITLPPNFPGQPPQITLMATANPHTLLDLHSNVVHPKLNRWNPYSNLAELFSEIVQDFSRSPPSIISQNPALSAQQQMQFQQQQQQQMQMQMQQQQQQQNQMMRQPNGTPVSMSGYHQPSMGGAQPQMGMYGSGSFMQPSMQMYRPPMQQQPQQQQPQQQPQQSLQQQIQAATSHTQLPGIPSMFPELANKSLAELQQIDQNPAKFDELFQNLDWMKNVNCLIEDIRKGNTAIAEKNLSQEAGITALEEELKELKTTVGQQRGVVDQKYQKQQEILQQFAPRNLLDKLAKATSQAEIDSDSFVNDYLENNAPMNINDFVKQYMEKRTLFYLRKAKKERFARSQGVY